MKHQIMAEPKRIAPCCNFKGNIPLDDYHNHIQQYIKQLDQGIKIPECRLCWETEDNGFVSVRQSGNQDIETFQGQGTTYLDIRLDNECNLACNMCSSDFSTLWGKLKGHSLLTLPSSSVEKISSITKDLKRVSIQGGEPFYGNKYINFIDDLPNKSQISIDIFSNIITANMSVIEQWTHEFKKVSINASVDGYKDSYNYIRWPTTWDKWSKKAVQLHDIPNVTVNYFYCIQADNVLSIIDFVKWRNTFTPNRHIVFTPVYHEDITYQSLTAQERDQFLKQEQQLMSLLHVDSREYSEIAAFIDLVKQMTPQQNLIQQRKNFNSSVDAMRNNYKNKINTSSN